MTKIKVFEFTENHYEADIEKEINKFISDKEVIDIKITTVPYSYCSNSTIIKNVIYYTILYKA